MPMKIARGGLM